MNEDKYFYQVILTNGEMLVQTSIEKWHDREVREWAQDKAVGLESSIKEINEVSPDNLNGWLLIRKII